MLAALVVVLSPGVRGQTPSFAGQQVLSLKNGANAIDVDGDGISDLVFVGWRENYNAHGAEYITFYLRDQGPRDTLPRWYLIPFFTEHEEAESFGTEQGADCILRDLRIVDAGKGAPVTIVVAQRAFGRSYADADSVTFSIYEVKQNREGHSGRPPVWLERTQTILSRHPYCDVDEAMFTELGIGAKALGQRTPSDGFIDGGPRSWFGTTRADILKRLGRPELTIHSGEPPRDVGDTVPGDSVVTLRFDGGAFVFAIGPTHADRLADATIYSPVLLKGSPIQLGMSIKEVRSFFDDTSGDEVNDYATYRITPYSRNSVEVQFDKGRLVSVRWLYRDGLERRLARP